MLQQKLKISIILITCESSNQILLKNYLKDLTLGKEGVMYLKAKFTYKIYNIFSRYITFCHSSGWGYSACMDLAKKQQQKIILEDYVITKKSHHRSVRIWCGILFVCPLHCFSMSIPCFLRMTVLMLMNHAMTCCIYHKVSNLILHIKSCVDFLPQ